MIVDGRSEGKRLDRVASFIRPDLSRSYIKKLIESGHITVNGKPARPARKLREGERVEVEVPAPEPSAVEPEAMKLDIVYEDDDIIIINKPAGLVVHPGAGHTRGTLVSGLLGHTKNLSGIGGVQRPGIVHRIDKDTSGLIAAAKNDKAHRALSAQLMERAMSRVYIAVVKGGPKSDQGSVSAPIGRHPSQRKKMTVRGEGGREAVTRYCVVQRLEGASVLELKLDTGRTHQIRVHMLHLNCPVMGDETYGRGDKRNLIDRQALHAWRLTLRHPRTGAELSFIAPLPRDMRTLISRLGGDTTPYL
ncbi:MAG: RluA family pseudouridine synthase [Nitrospinae bacterium]|nr:RluA family pseudouridine synthase [Nitrospinota bacterium]